MGPELELGKQEEKLCHLHKDNGSRKDITSVVCTERRWRKVKDQEKALGNAAYEAHMEKYKK